MPGAASTNGAVAGGRYGDASGIHGFCAPGRETCAGRGGGRAARSKSGNPVFGHKRRISSGSVTCVFPKLERDNGTARRKACS